MFHLLMCCKIKYTQLLETLISDIKKEVKPATSTLHQGDTLAECWLESTSSDFLHNEHVIASRFQLEQDTDLDSCMLKCLHLRIPPSLSDEEMTETNLIGSVTNCCRSRFKIDSRIHLLCLSHREITWYVDIRILIRSVLSRATLN